MPRNLCHVRDRHIGAAGFQQRVWELRVARLEFEQSAINGGQQRHLLSVQASQCDPPLSPLQMGMCRSEFLVSHMQTKVLFSIGMRGCKSLEQPGSLAPLRGRTWLMYHGEVAPCMHMYGSISIQESVTSQKPKNPDSPCQQRH